MVLIHLAKTGLLFPACKCFGKLYVTRQVHGEVVDAGVRKGYEDAFEVQRAVKDGKVVVVELEEKKGAAPARSRRAISIRRTLLLERFGGRWGLRHFDCCRARKLLERRIRRDANAGSPFVAGSAIAGRTRAASVELVAPHGTFADKVTRHSAVPNELFRLRRAEHFECAHHLRGQLREQGVRRAFSARTDCDGMRNAALHRRHVAISAIADQRRTFLAHAVVETVDRNSTGYWALADPNSLRRCWAHR